MRQITRMPNGQHTFDSFQMHPLKASLGLLVIGKLGTSRVYFIYMDF